MQIIRGKLDDVNIVVNEEKSVDCSTRVVWLDLEISEKYIKPTIEKADHIAMLKGSKAVTGDSKLLSEVYAGYGSHSGTYLCATER